MKGENFSASNKLRKGGARPTVILIRASGWKLIAAGGILAAAGEEE